MAIRRWASGILAYVRMRVLSTKAERAAIKMMLDDIAALPMRLYFRKPLETQKPPV